MHINITFKYWHCLHKSTFLREQKVKNCITDVKNNNKNKKRELS